MQFIRYILIQVIAYSFDMGGYIFLLSYSEFHPLYANITSKILAGIFAFIAHRNFTFVVGKTKGSGIQAARYFSLFFLNIPLSSLLLVVILMVIPISTIGKFLSDVVCVLLTYWLSCRFIFSQEKVSSVSEVKSE